MLDIDTMSAIQNFLDSHIAPGVSRHGGTVEIIDFKGSTITISLGGSCAICSLDTQTTSWIKSSIEQNFPSISECKVVISRDSKVLDIQQSISSPINPFDF